jgi:hypothetical protein
MESMFFCFIPLDASGLKADKKPVANAVRASDSKAKTPEGKAASTNALNSSFTMEVIVTRL